MTGLDITLTVIALIIIVRAGLRGFITEFFGLAWLVLGLLAAFLFFDAGAAFIRTKAFADVPYVPEAAAFALIYLAVFAAVKILGHMIKDIADRVHLGTLDHALGVIFGAAEAAVIIFAVLYLLKIQPLFDAAAMINTSAYAQILLPHAPEVEIIIKETFR
jgi:membrane protein required for colicin V production